MKQYILNIVSLAISIVLFCVSAIFTIYMTKRVKKAYRDKDNSKQKHGIYYYVIASGGGAIVSCFFAIELLFRIPFIQELPSSFDEETSIQIFVGLVGALATVMLGIITIIFSKVIDDKNNNTKKLRDVSIKYEQQQKEKHNLMQIFTDCLSGMEGNYAHIFDNMVEFCGDSEQIHNLSYLLNDNKNSMFILLEMEHTIPLYIKINILEIKLTITGKDIYFKTQIQNRFGKNYFLIYFPIQDRKDTDELVFFQYGAMHFKSDYNKCGCEIRAKIVDARITGNVQISLDLHSEYRCDSEYLPVFLIRDVKLSFN